MTEKTKRKNWTLEQTEAVIFLYQKMVALQQAGKLGMKREQTSKLSLLREFMERFPDRSRGSVEMKLMNITYCRQQAGLPVVDGYKPLSKCSNDLLEAFNVKGGDQ